MEQSVNLQNLQYPSTNMILDISQSTSVHNILSYIDSMTNKPMNQSGYYDLAL